MKLERILTYYQECYKKEFRESVPLNIYSKQVFTRLFLQNIKVLFREEENHVLDQDVAAEVYKHIELHKKTRMLRAYGFFIAGKFTLLGKIDLRTMPKKVATPLKTHA